MAASQSQGEPQSGRGHGRKGSLFSLGNVKSKKDDENTLEVAGSERQGLIENLGQEI